MGMINVTIVGNLATAPELTSFASGRVKTILVVAVNSQSQKQGKADSPDYYRVEVWGRLAEVAEKYLGKGNQVGVCGRLIMDRWTDKEGNERVTPVISATQLSFPPRLSGGRDGGVVSGKGSLSSLDDDDLFAGARAVTVAEPPAEYYFCPRELTVGAVAGR